MADYTDVSAVIRRWLTACINPNKGVAPDCEFRPPESSICNHQLDTAGVLTVSQEKLLNKIQIRNILNKSVRARPLYDNCLLLSQDGKPLSRCSWRKATWYLRNGLASCKVQEGEEMRVQLKFRPKHRTRGLVGQFYLQRRDNLCVVCGGDGHRRKHVVPRRIRRLLPEVMKSHQSHDVLLLCTACHDRSHRWDTLQVALTTSSPSAMVSSFLSSGGLLQLEIVWRSHFLKTMQPRHLPEMWSIHHQGERLWYLASKQRVTPQLYKLATQGTVGEDETNKENMWTE
eukprot:GFUD01002746.1.p1 GENE.GFUD01002746.1~~GFUD01002746.1.p1  ORF type:complete len:286 (+),score=79.95 GFUD01002746.1:317-1174(+)